MVHPPASDKERRINRGVELRVRFDEILEHDYIGAVEQQLTDSAAGERSPQLCWK
jgi:hypothetical protein